VLPVTNTVPERARPRVYSYAACSTCRKALAWLAERSIAVEIIDITQQPPAVPELRLALEQLGRSRLFNTSGQRYRALGAEAVRALSDGQAIEALGADGRLIKRPFLITPAGAILTGFQPDAWSSLLTPDS
jgi:arsenate reductase (glutaredoxin)